MSKIKSTTVLIGHGPLHVNKLLHEAGPIYPDMAPGAPHDGTKVKMWGKWMPEDGLVVWWNKDHWSSNGGIACFEKADRWEIERD